MIRNFLFACLVVFIFSCGEENRGIISRHIPKVENSDYQFRLTDSLDNNVYYKDTVKVKTAEDFVAQIKSNRVIKLMDKDYVFTSNSNNQKSNQEKKTGDHKKQGLLIEGIKNLKIIGSDSTRLLTDHKSARVLTITNAYNIDFDSLTFGHERNSEFASNDGVIRISNAYNIKIENSRILGYGTFGLSTNEIYNFNFANSEITECSAFVFELERSRKVLFENSKFYNNNLYTSVMGGFSIQSENIHFSNCDFLNNIPRTPGNPAFNQREVDDAVLFVDCTFKNNKGYIWYGDKLELKNCEIDSTDFLEFR